MKRILSLILRKLRPVRVNGEAQVSIKSKLLSRFTIDISGKNNCVNIGTACHLANTSIQISGENNNLIIEDKVRFYGPCNIRLQGNATLVIHEDAGIRGVEFTVIDGRMEIGKRCMFSYNIVVRNTDSHRVIDLATGEITNPSKDVILGEHVWVCQNSSILKGCHIGDNSIVAFGCVATKGCEPGCILAGNPARVVRTGITWDY